MSEAATPVEGLSRNNQLVLDALSRSKGPMSAYQLLDALRDKGLRAPPQVYRALKWLSGHGLVHKLQSANAYVACSHVACCGGAHQHAASTVFFLCENCGAVEEKSDSAFNQALSAIAKDIGFAPQTTAVEVSGICALCRAA
ncbi:MAG: Fur family transcriptional regulator [Pseudomonadota bacterium]